MSKTTMILEVFVVLGLQAFLFSQVHAQQPDCEDVWDNCEMYLDVCWKRVDATPEHVENVTRNCRRTCGACCSHLNCPELHFLMDCCWKDNWWKNGNKRVFPLLILTERGGIKWNNYNKWLPDFVCKCAAAAKKLGYHYFGIQYYGECWSGPDEYVLANYKRDGPSTDCVNEYFKSCWDSNPLLSGDNGHGHCCTGKGDAFKFYCIPQ